MQKSNFIAGLLLLVFTGWMLAYAIPNNTGSGMGFGLEPDGLPKAVTYIILVFAFVQTVSSARNLIQNRKSKTEDPEIGITKSLGLFAILLSCLMGGTVLLMKYAGFLVSGIVFMVIIQLICGQRNWIKLALLAVCTPLFLKLAFWYGMGVLLPTGILFQ